MAKLQIPVTKSKGNFIEIDTETDLDDAVFKEVVFQGLKVLLNRGASKITKASTKNEDEYKAVALEKAQEQLELVKTSKIKFTGVGKEKKLSGAVNTEAMRLARNLVKDEMKKAGIKISHVEASEITKAAKEVLASENGASIIEMAKANLEERSKVPVASTIVSGIKISEKKVKAAEAKKAKDQLSAKQAGKVKVRAKAHASA